MASGIILLLIFYCNRLLIRQNIFVAVTLNVKCGFPIMKLMSMCFSYSVPDFFFFTMSIAIWVG